MAIKRACATRVKGPRKQQNARTKNTAGQSLRGKVVFLGRMKKKADRLRVGCIRAAALSAALLCGLIFLGLAWELWLAPIRPGGSLLALKVLPLKSGEPADLWLALRAKPAAR